MNAPLAVLNIQRIGWAALKAHARHERREIGDLTHTDSARSPRNEVAGLDPCPETAAKMYIAQRKAKIDKRNERPFTRLVLSASPEYFRPDSVDRPGSYDPARVRAWTRETVAWLRKEFGKDAVHIALHLDETTPHIHALVVPTYIKETKRRRAVQVSHHKHPAFSGERSYEGCHDRYAKAICSLGIERGERAGGGKTHRTKRQWIAAAIRELRARSRRVEVALDAAQRVAERGRDLVRAQGLAAHRDALSEPLGQSRQREAER